MNGIPMSPQLLAALSQNTGQPGGIGALAPPPYVIKMLSQRGGTGLGNPQQFAQAQGPQYASQVGI